MTPQEFKKLVKERQKYTHETLVLKAVEYSRNKDRLHNFYSTAAMNNETAAQSLWGMCSKHITSIKDMIADTAEGHYPNEDQINEKLGDIINYMHLLEGLFIEGKIVELDKQINLNIKHTL